MTAVILPDEWTFYDGIVAGLWTGEPAPVDVMREAMEKEYGVELF